MKSPMDETDYGTQEHAAAPVAEKPPGGKALERLKLFEVQRGFSAAPPEEGSESGAEAAPVKTRW